MPRRAFAGWPAVSLVLLLAPTLVACGGSPGAGTSTPPSSASGCRQGLATGSTTLHLTVAGRDRLVIVHVPAGAAASARPLVLNLHGSGSTARQEEVLTGMDATADAHGFVVAYPQALIPMGGGDDWNVPGQPLFGGAPVPRDAADDVAFLTALPHLLAARTCIDTHRVFATGISGGGRMAGRLGCDAAATFAAVAPVAGLRLPDPCPRRGPVPVIAFHGTADPVDPYQGGGQAYWGYSVPDAAARWAAHDGCAASPSTTHGSGYTLDTWTACAAGGAVELYTLDGEGHEWPGGPPLPASITALLGPQSKAVDADEAMWAFFTAHQG